jgi:hypothetical protein
LLHCTGETPSISDKKENEKSIANFTDHVSKKLPPNRSINILGNPREKEREYGREFIIRFN